MYLLCLLYWKELETICYWDLSVVLLALTSLPSLFSLPLISTLPTASCCCLALSTTLPYRKRTYWGFWFVTWVFPFKIRSRGHLRLQAHLHRPLLLPLLRMSPRNNFLSILLSILLDSMKHCWGDHYRQVLNVRVSPLREWLKSIFWKHTERH